VRAPYRSASLFSYFSISTPSVGNLLLYNCCVVSLYCSAMHTVSANTQPISTTVCCDSFVCHMALYKCILTDFGIGRYQHVIVLWSYACTIATCSLSMTFWAKLTLHCKTYRSMNGQKGSKLIVINEHWIIAWALQCNRLAIAIAILSVMYLSSAVYTIYIIYTPCLQKCPEFGYKLVHIHQFFK